MRSFRNRVLRPEILDTLPPEAARASLDDLVRLNRHFGGHSAARHALRPLFNAADKFSLLDIGAASGDMNRAIRKHFPGARTTSLDYNLSHMAKADPPQVVADAFALPFKDGSFDVAFCSLFLHHFEDEEVVRLLAEMRRVSRRGVAVVDLHRHFIPYNFLAATRWLFGWDPVTVHDGAASVAAAFTTTEFRRLALEAGLVEPNAQSHGLSFRLTLSANTPARGSSPEETR